MDYDLVIIGYGAAGFAAMIKANEIGVKPALLGYGPIGGTCINVGCIPSKRMLFMSENNRGIDQNTLIKDKEDLILRLRKKKYEDLLSKYDVDLIYGKAHFISPNKVKIDGKIIEGKKFIISTGSSPKVPNIVGLKESGYWTNAEALSIPKNIDSLAIIGGSAMGLEFSQFYKNIGKDVVLIEKEKTLLPNWEPEISINAEKIIRDEEIYVLTDTLIKEVKKLNEGKLLITNKGEITVDEILISSGREPNIDLNLSAAYVEANEKGIKVDDELRTTNKNIFAAGDVISGNPMLESLAGKQGSIAAENALANSHKKIDMLSVPQSIFTEPNIARVGMTQLEAEKLYEVDTRTVKMESIAKASILSDERGLIKMIINKNDKRILGVHMIGKNAAEVINEAALALRFRLTIDDIIDTVHVFPTMGESLKIVSLAFYRDINKMSCCVD